MKVSVVMATYNGGQYLRAQLESIAAQTRVPDELIICDDCSDDETVGIARQFSEWAPFFVEVRRNEKNIGFVQNFGRALEISRGDLIFLSDQDDVWLPHKIERIEAEMIARPAMACLINDAYIADENLVRSGYTKWGQIRDAGLPDIHFVMGCCVAVRRELVNLALPIPDMVPAHDSWMVRVADELGLCHRLDVPLQDYRRHGKNVSDFFANNSASASWFSKLRSGNSASNRSEDRRVRFLVSLVARLESRPEAFSLLVGEAVYKSTLERLQKSLTILIERMKIRSLPRGRRIAAIIALWRSGGYRETRYVRGAFKDFLISKRSEEHKVE